MAGTLSKEQLELIDAYWRASNYLTVGQIYLQENPLLREALLVADHNSYHLGQLMMLRKMLEV